MAQHVLSIGMSHSTLVILDDSLWGEWAAQDAALAILFDTEGQAVTHAQLAERAGIAMLNRLHPGTGRNSTQPCDRRLLDWPPKLPLQDWMCSSSSGTISWNCSPLPICLRSPSFMASGSPVDSGPRASLRIKGMVSHPLLLLARGFSVLWRKATPWMPIANLPARRASRTSCSHP